MTVKTQSILTKILFKGILFSEICGVAGSLFVIFAYTLREFLFVDLINRQFSFQYLLMLFLASLIFGGGGAIIGGFILSLILHNDYKNHKMHEKNFIKKGIIIGFSLGLLLLIFIYSNYSINLISFDLLVLYSIITIIFATVSGWWVSYRLDIYIGDQK